MDNIDAGAPGDYVEIEPDQTRAAPDDAEEPSPDHELQPEVVEERPRPARTAARRPDPADHESALVEAAAKLDMPSTDDSERDIARIADLVAMAHTLEERDGSDQVMFNALCSESAKRWAPESMRRTRTSRPTGATT